MSELGFFEVVENTRAIKKLRAAPVPRGQASSKGDDDA